MNNKPPDNAGHRSWAHLRFAIVGPLLAAPPENLGEAIEELASRTWQHPTRPAKQLKFGFSTIERWYYEARRTADPVGRLTRRIRKDAGLGLGSPSVQSFGLDPRRTTSVAAGTRGPLFTGTG